MALPLAVIGLGGVLALVLLRGEQPSEQASGGPVQATSRPTLVSVHRSQVVVPTSSDAFVLEVPEEMWNEVRDAVRSGPGSTAAAASAAEPSTVEERRRRGEPRTHRHRPSSAAPLPSAATSSAPLSSAATSSAAVEPPTSAPDSTPSQSPTVDPAPVGSVETITPTSTPEPVAPTSAPASAPAPESAPASEG